MNLECKTLAGDIVEIALVGNGSTLAQAIAETLKGKLTRWELVEDKDDLRLVAHFVDDDAKTKKARVEAGAAASAVPMSNGGR